MATALARTALRAAGLVLVGTGGAAWVAITQQLRAQHITVPADADHFAGQPVAGPVTAFAQAAAIEKHALKMADGKSYAGLGEEVAAAKRAGDTERASRLAGTREIVLQANLLRASLFTSVLAYGVSALAVGMGVLTGVVAAALPRD